MFALLSLVACGSSPAAPGPAVVAPIQVQTGSVEAALAGPHRTDEERARDAQRHPVETLAFFGVRPGMTVIEIWPGGRGWYTKVLAPLLRDEGRLILATLDPEDDTFRGAFARQWRDEMALRPEIYDRVERTVLFGDRLMDDVPDGSVDVVLTFRSAHNWIRWEGHDPQAYVSAVARVLRPGGVFGVVQHRAPDGHPEGETGNAGYVTEAIVVRWATEAGLVLDARSEINANPNDDHDHPEGVWSLPPTLRGGDEGREAFLAIGESDRMTLRFRKPETDGSASTP